MEATAIVEQQKKITKRKIAETQLCRAVVLLEDDVDYISALTLAGAAEEILGKMVQRKGGTTAFEDWAVYTRSFWDYAAKRANEENYPLHVPDDKGIKSRLNETRNEVKHNDQGKNVKVHAMFQYAAEDMLLRACKNYLKLYNRLPKNKRLVDWWENITL
jgi:hypothetical protein